MEVDRVLFEQFLADRGDVEMSTHDIDDCPLAEFLQAVTGDKELMVDHSSILPGPGGIFELPEWAKTFSQLSMVGTGEELLHHLLKIPA